MEEKRVLLIPCVIDDCEIPLFLREKLYVDFRKDKSGAFELLDRSLRRASNPSQSRIDRLDFHTDWSVDWGDVQGSNVVEWLFVDHGEKAPYCIVTRCRLIFDGKKANAKFLEHLGDGTQIEYACQFLSDYVEVHKNGDFRVQIEDYKEISEVVPLRGKGNEKAIFYIGIRRLGLDNGMDTLFTVDEILRRAVKHSFGVLRKP